MKRRILASLIFAALLTASIAPTAYAQEPIKITPKQLADEYDENEIAADQKYKGKILEMSGEIDDFGKGIFDAPYIKLEAGFLSWVYCYLSKSYEPQLAQLSKGQRVTVQGVCDGIGFAYPELKDCILVETTSPPSPQPSPTSPTSPSAPPAEEDEGCFIATAAYGTNTAQEIAILRDFRDEILLQNSLGAQFVSFYYNNSPPIADFISQNDALRAIVREGFVDPIVAVLELSKNLWTE